MDGETPGGGGSACILRTVANDPANSVNLGGSVDRGQNLAAIIGSSCCQRAATVLPTLPPVNPADYIALLAAKDEPCHVCGRRPMSWVLRGGGLYLCYDCLKKAKRPAKVQPLPGVLERSEENL